MTPKRTAIVRDAFTPQPVSVAREPWDALAEPDPREDTAPRQAAIRHKRRVVRPAMNRREIAVMDRGSFDPQRP